MGGQQTPPVTSPPPLFPVRPLRPGGSSAGIVTGEAVALDLRAARLPTRALATAIDLAVQYVALLVVLLALGGVLGATGADPAASGALLVVVLVALLLGYPIGMTVLTRGRTLGKLAVGLRVVREDGGPVLFRQALTREIVGFVVEKPGPLLFLPAVVSALVREDGRRIGDLAAGTLVISERVSGSVVALPPMPPPLAGWAAGLDLSRLSDATALRARQLLTRSGQLRPEAREAIGSATVAEVATAVGPVPAGTPGWAYLAAVLAERRRRDALRLAQRTATAGVAGRQPGRAVGTAAYDTELV